MMDETQNRNLEPISSKTYFQYLFTNSTHEETCYRNKQDSIVLKKVFAN